MSRIVQVPVEPGDPIAAADLNNRFNAFSQAGAVNQFNLRDAAIDLAHFKTTDFLCRLSSSTNIGKSDLFHAAPVSVASYTGATYPTPHPVQDGAGNPTPLSFGLTGWTVTPDEILRIYWDLSVRPRYSGTPWTNAGSIGSIILAPGGASHTVASNATCWAAWLEWDITSNALSTWAPVTYQGSWSSQFAGRYGEQLNNTTATTAIPAWIQHVLSGDQGSVGAGSRVDHRHFWRGVSGTYYLTPAGNTTIYGIRVVLAGLYHPFNNGGNNYLTVDPNQGGAGQTLEYTGGGLGAVVHRVK
jgi:hypothetical protein